MLQKIMAYIARFHMIEPGDRIVAGVSGGADSVCLFHALCELQKCVDFSFEAVYVNHCIRKEAGDDAAFVEQLCKEHGIPFWQVREDVPGYARRMRISEEEAGREVRYRAFERICREAGGDCGKIAVAHHLDDRAETVLFQLFRGSGIHGLIGMEPVRVSGGMTVIRPLLGVTRGEITAWLDAQGIAYRTDATNETDHYARNRIRHHILPYAQKEICQRSAEHISQTADLLSLAADYLDGRTDAAFMKCVTKRGGGLMIRADAFEALHPYLQGSLIHSCFGGLVPHARDIAAIHVDAVCGLFAKQVGRRISLPYGITAQRICEGVLLSEKDQTDERARRRKDACPCGPGEESGDAGGAVMQEESVYLPPAEESPEGTVFFAGLRIDYRVFAYDGERQFPEGIPKKDFTKWFDYGKIKQSLSFRFRQQGDVLTVTQAGEKKSLKKYMIDRKIPVGERAAVPLLADQDRILWVIGYRIGEDYKVSVQTKKVMEIHVSGGKCDG